MKLRQGLGDKLSQHWLIGAFRVKDQQNRSFFNRIKWLLVFSLLIIGLFFLLQNRQINLLINRDVLEKEENYFLNDFYSVYNDLYYWLIYQGNLAEQFYQKDRETPEKFWRQIEAAVQLNTKLTQIQFGVVGADEHWQTIKKEDGSWTLENSFDQEFVDWLAAQNYQENQIYWGPTNVQKPHEIELFWFFLSPEKEKVYFKASVPFNHENRLLTQDSDNEQILVAFVSENDGNRTFLLSEASYSSMLTDDKKLTTSEQGQLGIKRMLFMEQLTQLSSDQILQKLLHQGQSVFNFKLDKENFWVKITPVQTQTQFNQLVLVALEQSPLSRFGISIKAVFIVILITLSLNFLAFLIYYFQYSRRFYFYHHLQEIIKGGEGKNLEFKSSLRFDYQENKLNKNLEGVILKSLAAFNNTDGGLLIIGIDDQGKILGLKPDYQTVKKHDKDGFELHLRELISQSYGEHFAARRIEIMFPVINKQEICLIKVKKGKTPIYTMTTDKNGVKQEKFYIRLGNSSREIEKPSDIVTYQNERFLNKWKWIKK